jgi:hypothetical protein
MPHAIRTCGSGAPAVSTHAASPGALFRGEFAESKFALCGPFVFALAVVLALTAA